MNNLLQTSPECFIDFRTGSAGGVSSVNCGKPVTMSENPAMDSEAYDKVSHAHHRKLGFTGMRCILSLAVLMLLMFAPVILASASDRSLVIDEAGLLDTDECSELETKAEELSEECMMDIVILTVNTLDDKTATEYADDYFDYNGYGRGDNYDGILFMLDMGSRSWAISTSGYAIEVFTDYGQELMMDEILPYLSDGDYYNAFDSFLELCEEYYDDAQNGYIVDSYYDDTDSDYYDVSDGSYSSSYGSGGNLILCILISLAVGFLLAGIPISAWKKKLKNVQFSSGASEYLKPGSFELTVSSDNFLYHTVTRTPIPKENSGGGSSTHVGSSGHSHGGSSGHF